jgi:hypothetical protein
MSGDHKHAQFVHRHCWSSRNLRLLTCAIQYFVVCLALGLQASLDFALSFLNARELVTDILLETAQRSLSLGDDVACRILGITLDVLLNGGCICLALPNNFSDLVLETANDVIYGASCGELKASM